MKELSYPKHFCNRQRLSYSPVQIKARASSPRSMLRRQAPGLALNAWLSTVSGVQKHHSQMLRYDPIILLIESRINDESFLI